MSKRLQRLVCAVIGHRYLTALHFSPTHRIVACRRCYALYGMEDVTQSFLPWDDDLTQVYKDAPIYDPKTGAYNDG